MDLPVAGQAQRDEVARIMVRLGLVDMVNSQKSCIAALAAYLAAPVVAALDRHLEFLVESRSVGKQGDTASPRRVVGSIVGLDIALRFPGTLSAAKDMRLESRGGSPNWLTAGLAVPPEAVGVGGGSPAKGCSMTDVGTEVTTILSYLRRLASEHLSARLAGDGRVVVSPPSCERVLCPQFGEALRSARRWPTSSQACLGINVLAADNAGDNNVAAPEVVMAGRPAELMLVGFNATGRTLERLAA